jgi:poly-beta-1,6-N-acetyl-D-glucosamine synthase
MSRRYLIISPVRDEAAFMRRTLDSVTRQSVPPALWVIVDDGSTDGTAQILAEYAQRFSYIRVVQRKNRGARSVGPGVIEAFYQGLESVPRLEDFTYLCKLDMDLDLPPRYFETLMQRMEAEPRLGTCSGKAYFPGPANLDKSWGGELISERLGDEGSVGAAKFYRVACFLQIGGFVRQVMWDGIDCHRCRMLGWIACSWDHPDLRFIHLRPMGSSQRGILTGRMRHGFGQYFMGTSFAYLAASAAYRLTQRPALVGSAAMVWGYLESALHRRPRFADPEFRRFLRRYQWQCLLLGKQRATARTDAQVRSRWQPGAAAPSVLGKAA